MKSSRERYLETSLRRLEDIGNQAHAEGAHRDAISATKAALEVHAELDQLRAMARRARQKQPDAAGHKAEMLSEVRRMRQSASEAGSFVAAANLLKSEREMLAANEAERISEAQRLREHLDEGGLLAELVEACDRLPADVRRQLAQILEAGPAEVH
jgi:hypothetical protein